MNFLGNKNNYFNQKKNINNSQEVAGNDEEEFIIPENVITEKLRNDKNNSKNKNNKYKGKLEEVFFELKNEEKIKKISKSYTLEKKVIDEIKKLAEKNKTNESKLLNKILTKILF